MKLKKLAFSILGSIFSSIIGTGIHSTAIAQGQNNALKTSQAEACLKTCACTHKAAKETLEMAKVAAPFTSELKPYEQLLQNILINPGNNGSIALAMGKEQILASRICVETNAKTKKSKLVIYYHGSDPASFQQTEEPYRVADDNPNVAT